MINYLPATIGWPRFFASTAILIIIYILIKELLAFFVKTEFSKKRRLLNRGIEIFMRLFEPVLIILILILFVRVNPVVHGIILLLITILSFGLLRDYVSGIVFHLSKAVGKGTRMAIDDSKGIVSDIGRLGLDLQTAEGDEFLAYSKIVKHHKFLVNDNIKGLVRIRFNTSEQSIDMSTLRDKLSAVPYIDWSISPKLQEIDASESRLELRLTDTAYLKQLKQLLGEQGYTTLI